MSSRAIPPRLYANTDTALQKREATASVSSIVSEKVSTLARQLAESTGRAEARERELTRSVLGSVAQRIGEQIFGLEYHRTMGRYHDQRPDTTDPELLERARLATEYVEKPLERGSNLKNPFQGLSRDQLNLIIYDDAGPYTKNERHAAFCEVCNIETKWNQKVMRIYDIEAAQMISNRPNFCIEVLSHLRNLPLIEQVQYPDNYESRLEARINETPEK